MEQSCQTVTRQASNPGSRIVFYHVQQWFEVVTWKEDSQNSVARALHLLQAPWEMWQFPFTVTQLFTKLLQSTGDTFHTSLGAWVLILLQYQIPSVEEIFFPRVKRTLQIIQVWRNLQSILLLKAGSNPNLDKVPQHQIQSSLNFL